LNPDQAQADVEAAKKQQAFFQQHLQELTLFKAKTSAALLQVRCRTAAALPSAAFDPCTPYTLTICASRPAAV